MVLGHNHLSGNVRPGKEDDRITNQDKYNFKLSNCSWMCREIFSERSY